MKDQVDADESLARDLLNVVAPKSGGPHRSPARGEYDLLFRARRFGILAGRASSSSNRRIAVDEAHCITILSRLSARRAQLQGLSAAPTIPWLALTRRHAGGHRDS